MQPTTAQHLVDALRDSGMTTLFGVHGANIEDVLDAAVRTPGITPVIAKHEFGAGAMADGVARLTGHPCAVATTSGGAAMNVIAALAESYDSRVPVLALVGTTPTVQVGRGGFQDMICPPDTIDLASILDGVTGSVSVLGTAADLGPALATAMTTLRRDLPAALVIPKDIQKQVSPGVSVACASAEDRASIDDAIAALAQRITSAVADRRRICLWVGEEASRRTMRADIAELADIIDATVVATPGGRDLGGGVRFAGVTGVMGHPSAQRAVATSDLCLAIGCRMTVTDRAGLDDALAATNLVHVGLHPPRFGGCSQRVVGDVGRSVDLLIKHLRGTDGCGRVPQARVIECLPVPDQATKGVPMREAVEIIGAHCGNVRAVFADAGNAGAATIHHLPFGPARFVVALGMGGMGYAIAAGIGCAIHEPSGRIVVIAGDGAFLMHGNEFHTAVQYGAPVTLIILNNNAHGMCVTREQIFFPDTPSINLFRPADIAAGIAAMYPDVEVVGVQSIVDLDAGCARLLGASGPNCIVVDCDPDEIPPFAPLLPKGTS